MRQFFVDYWRHLKALPKNFYFYVWLFLILSCGHTPKGKVAAVLISVLIIPLFQIGNDLKKQSLD
jgi:hypothetical protein